ncbi:MAG: TetR family transcriptional regulator [Sneathiella sp.]
MNEVVGKRATSEAQKMARRIKVLNAASSLFTEAGFFDVSMSMIAKKAGVAKGTVYLYFSTKEEIFLALCTDELGIWLLHLESQLSPITGPLENEQFVAILRKSFEGRDAMYRLIALMHLVLEKNVSLAEMLDFKRNLLKLTVKISERVEIVLPYLEKGDGLALMTTFHSLVVGWSQMTETSPIMEKVLEIPEMAPFKFDMLDNLFRSFKLVLDGVKYGNQK